MTEQTNNVNSDIGNNVHRNPANNPERNVHLNESFEEYTIRRESMNKEVKKLKYGKQFHDSAYHGTYRNDAKRLLQAERKARRAEKRGV